MLAPMNNAICLSLFLRQHRPLAGILVDSPSSSSLVLAASGHGVKLALLNAKLPAVHRSPSLPHLLSKFDLVLPATESDHSQLSIAGADLERMPGWCPDLSSASILGSGSWLLSQPDTKDLTLLQQALGRAPSWIAAHLEAGEEAVVAQVHMALLAARGLHAGGGKLRTIVVPAEGRWDERWEIREVFESRGLTVDSWTYPGAIYKGDVLLVADPGLLPLLYLACETVLICGGSLVHSSSQSINKPPDVDVGMRYIADPCSAGCAVLIGPALNSHVSSSLALAAEDLNGASLMATEEVAAAIRSTGLDVDVAEPAQVLGVEGQDEEVVDAGPLIHMDERHSSLSSSASPFLLGLKTPPPAPSRTSGPALTSPPMSLGSQDEVIEGWLQLTSPHHLKGIVIKPQAASEPPALHPALDLWSDHHTSSQLSAPLTSDGAVTTYSFSNHKDQGAQSGIRKSSMTFQASSSMGPLSRPRTLSSVSQGRRGSGSGSGAAVNVNRLLSLSEITPTSVEASVLAHEASSPMGTPNDKAAARKTIPHRESFTVWLDSNPSSPDSPAGDKSWKRKKEKEKPVSFKDLLSPSSSSQLSHPSSPMEDDVIDEEPVVDEIAELPQIKTMRLKRDEAKSGSSLDRPPSSSSSPHRPMEASLGHMAEGFMALSLHQADRRRERTNLSIQAPSNLNEARPVAHGPWMPLDSDGNVESDPNSPHLCKAVEGGSPVLRWNVDLFDAEGFATRSGSSGSLNRPPPRITYWNLVTESSDKDLGSPPSASKLSPYPRSDLRTPAPSAAINSHKLDSSHGSPFPSPSSSSSTIKKALTMSPLTKNQSQSVRTREGGSEEPGLRSPFYAEPSHPHPLTPLSPRRHHVDFAIDPLAPAETTDVVPDTPTSRMSGSSPFSGSTMDRPCPFRISANGSRVSVDPDLSSEIEFCASPASSSARKYSWGYGSLGARRLNQRAIEASRRSDPTVSSVARGESCELKCGLTNGSKERTSASFIGDMASSSSGLLPSEAGSERRRSSALEAIPDTPTSRMSGSSVFAVGAVFDRPCPFVVTSTGAHADVSTLPVARETTLPERPSGSWGSSPASPDQALTPTPLLPNTCYSPTPKWSMKDKDQDEQDESHAAFANTGGSRNLLAEFEATDEKPPRPCATSAFLKSVRQHQQDGAGPSSTLSMAFEHAAMDMGSVDMPAMFLQAFGSTRYPSPSNDEYENRSGSNEGFVLDSFGSNIDLGLLAKSSPVVVGPASSSAPPPPPLAAVNVDRVAPLPFAPTLDIRLRAPSPKLEGEETLMHSTTQDLPPPFVTATTTTLPPPSPRRVPLASPLRRSLNRRVEERGEVPPDTPVSAMSGSSIFSVGAVFDRPCPFTISRRGSHINLIDNPAPAPPAAAPPPPSPTQSVKAPSDVESRDQGICDTDATEARVNMTSSSATAPPPPLPLPLPLPTPQFTPAAVQAGAICLESWRQRGHDEWVEALRTGLDGQTLGPDLYAPLSIGGHSRSSSLAEGPWSAIPVVTAPPPSPRAPTRVVNEVPRSPRRQAPPADAFSAASPRSIKAQAETLSAPPSRTPSLTRFAPRPQAPSDPGSPQRPNVDLSTASVAPSCDKDDDASASKDTFVVKDESHEMLPSPFSRGFSSSVSEPDASLAAHLVAIADALASDAPEAESTVPIKRKHSRGLSVAVGSPRPSLSRPSLSRWLNNPSSPSPKASSKPKLIREVVSDVEEGSDEANEAEEAEEEVKDLQIKLRDSSVVFKRVSQEEEDECDSPIMYLLKQGKDGSPLRSPEGEDLGVGKSSSKAAPDAPMKPQGISPDRPPSSSIIVSQAPPSPVKPSLSTPDRSQPLLNASSMDIALRILPTLPPSSPHKATASQGPSPRATTSKSHFEDGAATVHHNDPQSPFEGLSSRAARAQYRIRETMESNDSPTSPTQGVGAADDHGLLQDESRIVARSSTSPDSASPSPLPPSSPYRQLFGGSQDFAADPKESLMKLQSKPVSVLAARTSALSNAISMLGDRSRTNSLCGSSNASASTPFPLLQAVAASTSQSPTSSPYHKLFSQAAEEEDESLKSPSLPLPPSTSFQPPPTASSSAALALLSLTSTASSTSPAIKAPQPSLFDNQIVPLGHDQPPPPSPRSPYRQLFSDPRNTSEARQPPRVATASSPTNAVAKGMEGLEGLNLRPLKLPTSATCSSAAAAATDPIFSQTDSSLSHQLGAALQQQAATALAVAAGERGRQMELATATSLLSPRAAGQPSSIYNELQTLKAQLQGVKGRLSDPPPPSYPSFSPVPKSPRKAQESSRSSPPAVASSEMQALVSEVSAMRSQMQMFAEVLMSQGSLLKSIQLQLNEALQSSREQRQEVHTHAPTDQSLQAALDDETRAGQRQRKYGSNDVAADQSSSAVPRSGPIELQGVQDELITPPPGLRALAEWQSEVSPLKTPYGVTRGLLSAPHTSSSLVLPARFIPNRGQGTGPAIWVVQQSGGGEDGIVGKVAEAVGACLDDEVERRSRGLAGAQASAKLAWSLVGNVWGALDEKVIAPALQKYVMTNSATGRTANTTTRL